jgi:hypothetical protein
VPQHEKLLIFAEGIELAASAICYRRDALGWKLSLQRPSSAELGCRSRQIAARKGEKRKSMMPSKKSLLLSAALAGLLGGTMTRAVASPSQDNGQTSTPAKKPAEKHACAGKNSCKGKGGCATDGSKDNKAAAAGVTEKHACAGKNSCKGNGGCATDAKKKS